MKRINDIFYSLQGEGYNTGRAAVFVRFAGCNLRCPFCDTEFDSFREMTDDEIIEEMSRSEERGARSEDSLAAPRFKPLVVLTGGEPTLQVDEPFVDLLHKHGYEVAMESNGTRPAPRNLDWLTVSPKVGRGARSEERGTRNEGRGTGNEERGTRLPDELKVVFDENTDPESYLPSPFTLHPSPKLYLQPCDTGDTARNARIVRQCIDYIKTHPHWRLSLQTHKLADFK